MNRNALLALQHATPEHLQPLLAALQRWQPQQGGPLIVGLSGAQGAGKSTLAHYLQQQLQTQGQRVLTLALDDFYLGAAQRRQLAQRVHPLLISRGVPGTHDLPRLNQCLIQLRQAGPHTRIALPRFDKARDDRLPAREESEWQGPVDIVLLEGWCIGCPAQSPDQLSIPCNTLEVEEDRDGRWRLWVNQALQGPYRELFSQLDLQLYLQLYLQIPRFERVLDWRAAQERELAQRCLAEGRTEQGLHAQALLRFIAHFERLSRYMLEQMPTRADATLVLDEQQQIVQHHGRLFHEGR